MEKRTAEWWQQSDYDLATADYLFQGGRYLYSVFLCHLAIEKSLKGLYYNRFQELPPKSHNLVFLMTAIGLKPPEEQGRFVVKLSEASIPTRYPDDLTKIQKSFTMMHVQDILSKTKDLITWIKKQL